MTNYDDDELDDELLNNNEPAHVEEKRQARPSGSRNFLIALGILGGLFILVTIVLLLLYFNRPKGGQAADISATNVAIQTANAKTIVAATLAADARAQQQPTSTPVPTNTPIPAKPTLTSVLAQPTATNKAETPEAGGLASPTANAQTQTQSAPAVLTQSVQQTQTRQAAMNLTATATALPNTGFADEVGLPGLFGIALGLILIIILVRRMRLSTSH